MLAYYIEDRPFMMLGSMHVLPSQLVEAMENFLDSLLGPVQLLIIEADLDARPDLRITFLPEGESLSGIVGGDLYVRALSLAQEFELPEESIQAVKPWWAAMLLGQHLLSGAGLTQPGLDRIALDRAHATNKEVLPLETFESAFAGLESVPLQEAIDFLRFTIDHRDRVQTDMEIMVRGWSIGDEGAFCQILEQRLQLFPSMFKSLIVDRNRNWLVHLEDALERRIPTLLVAGSLHFVGPDNLPDLLREREYIVHRILPPNPGPQADG